jgi:hypothetical protein
MQSATENILGRAFFDDPSTVHHDNAVNEPG